ncbi:MAG: hypothetical protein ACRDJE_05550 [Dehalococcoidia bacterium]
MATFYRVVKRNPPTERDFLSMQALGRRLRADTPENRRIYDGVSVYATLDGVRFLVERFPHMGAFVAILEVEEGKALRVEQTTPDPDHYTLWASSETLLATVVEVVTL